MATDLEIIQIAGEHRIDSRLVAKSLGIEHESFIRTLYTYEAELQELGILRFEIGEIKGRGQPQKYALLNEDQAIFAATLRWLWSVYFPLHFPAYTHYRTRYVARSEQKQLLAGKRGHS